MHHDDTLRNPVEAVSSSTCGSRYGVCSINRLNILSVVWSLNPFYTQIPSIAVSDSPVAPRRLCCYLGEGL